MTKSAAFLSLILGGLSGLDLAAAPLRLEGLTFEPPVFEPGEVVVATATLADAEGSGLEPYAWKSSDEPMTSRADPEILAFEVSKVASGLVLKVRFVPWSPGPGTIAALQARRVLVPSLRYQAVSALGGEASRVPETELAPLRPQRDPPGAWLYLYGFAGLVLALVLAAIGSVTYLLPAARKIIARLRVKQAYRRLCHDVDFLSKSPDSVDPVPYYAALARSLRLYLAARVEPSAPALTSAELVRLSAEVFPKAGVRESAATLLAEADRVRYAGERPAPAAMRGAARRTRELAKVVEEALDARV